VLLLSPSIPTQGEDQVFSLAVQLTTLGCVQLPITSVAPEPSIA
jgi:hypothetical protein